MINAQGGHALTEKKKENLFSAIYIGGLFISIAVIYISHLPSSLWDRLVDFVLSLTLSPVPGTGISLPAPADPAALNNIELYMAGFELAIAIGILEIIILFLRVFLHSPLPRIAETIENIVFWLGTSYLIITYLVNMTMASEWFIFWAGIVLIFGLALVARAFILLAKR